MSDGAPTAPRDLTLLLGLKPPGPRPREIHRNYCAHCPSRPGYEPDPITLDFMTYPFEVRRDEGVFPCGWRPQKMCRGICERLGITEEHLMGRPVEMRTLAGWKP